METKPRRLKPGKLIFIGLLSLILASASVSWAQIVVTNTNNSGPGSLRQAILDARTDPLPNIITFDPVLFPATINVLSLLPVLNGAGDTIDGGGNVTLNAVNLTATTDHGIRIFASDITLQGLTIQNFGGFGIFVQPNPNAPGGQSGQTLTNVAINGNNLTNNGRGIFVLGGEDNNQLDEITITGNACFNNRDGGIGVIGSNPTGSGGNRVSVTISANVIRGVSPLNPNQLPTNPLAGDGINVTGAGRSNTGSNVIDAIISDNSIQNTFGEGLRVVGANTESSASNNTINAVITGNNIQGSGLGTSGSGTGITVAGGPTVAFDATTSGNEITFLVDGNQSSNNRNNGIAVIGNNGSNHVVKGTISNNSFNSNGDSGIRLLGQGSSNTLQDIDILANNARGNLQGGLTIFGGDIVNTDHATISNVLIDGNKFDGNNLDGISATLGTGPGNVISLTGITNNSINTNLGGDGIIIRAGINGSATPIAGNAANRNSEDGIDTDAVLGYILSNNRTDRNAGCGISLGGNTDGGGNVGRNNGGGNIC